MPQMRVRLGFCFYKINVRSSHSQWELAMTGIRTQVLMVASFVVYHWATPTREVNHWICSGGPRFKHHFAIHSRRVGTTTLNRPDHKVTFSMGQKVPY